MAISVFSSKLIHGHEPHLLTMKHSQRQSATSLAVGPAEQQSDGDSTSSTKSFGSRRNKLQSLTPRKAKRSSTFKTVTSPSRQFVDRKLTSNCLPGQKNHLERKVNPLLLDEPGRSKSDRRIIQQRISLLCRCKSDGATAANNSEVETPDSTRGTEEDSTPGFDAETRELIDDWSETWSKAIYDSNLSADLWFHGPLSGGFQPTTYSQKLAGVSGCSGQEQLSSEADNRAALCILQKLLRLAMSNTLTDTQASAVISIGRKLFPSIGTMCTRTCPSKASVLVDTVVRQTLKEIGDELSTSSMLWPAASRRCRSKSARATSSKTSTTACTELTKYIVMNALDIALTCAGRGMTAARRTVSSPGYAAAAAARDNFSNRPISAVSSRRVSSGVDSKNFTNAAGRLLSISLVDMFVDQLSKDVRENLATMRRKPSDAMLATARTFSDRINDLYELPDGGEVAATAGPGGGGAAGADRHHQRDQKPSRAQSARIQVQPGSAGQDTDPFAEVLMNLTLHDRLEDLRQNFVDGREMVELATLILRSYRSLSKTGQQSNEWAEKGGGSDGAVVSPSSAQQLGAHLVSQLIALTLRKLKVALDIDRISPEDLVAMVIAIDSGAFAAELRRNRVEASTRRPSSTASSSLMHHVGDGFGGNHGGFPGSIRPGSSRYGSGHSPRTSPEDVVVAMSTAGHASRENIQSPWRQNAPTSGHHSQVYSTATEDEAAMIAKSIINRVVNELSEFQ